MNALLSIALCALLAFAQSGFLLSAAADSTVDHTSVVAAQPGTISPEISPEACLAHAKGMKLAQIQTACCKAHKGICGCRAGKIVCCDNTASNEPECTCHGDEAVAE